MAASSSDSTVKGLAFLSVMRALSQLRGEQGKARVLSCMAIEVADAFRYKTLIASGWYPVAWYREMWRSIREGLEEGVEIARAIGRESLRQDLKLVHRFALSLLSPETLLSIGGRLTAKYYRPTRVVFEVDAKRARARYLDCAGWDENMWAEISAGIELMLELAGAKQIQVRLVAGGQLGHDFAEFQGFWS